MNKNRVINIHQKTLDDLEFSTVQSQLSEHCITNLGKESALKVVPFSEIEILKRELTYTNEYLSSFDNDNRIPNHGFETLTLRRYIDFTANTRLFSTTDSRISSRYSRL